MNLIKNMEVVFVAIVILAGVATFATAKVVPAPAPAAQATAKEKISTVVVSTKRLTAAQKARLDS
jgi:Flp pilus assembly protein CpaB